MHYFEIQERSDAGDDWDHIVWYRLFPHIYKTYSEAENDFVAMTSVFPSSEFRIVMLGRWERLKLWLKQIGMLWRERREYRRWKRDTRNSHHESQ